MGNSELYFLYGSRFVGQKEFFGVYPDRQSLSIGGSDLQGINYSIVDTLITEDQVLVVNVVLMESDCDVTDKEDLARRIVPFIDRGLRGGKIVFPPQSIPQMTYEEKRSFAGESAQAAISSFYDVRQNPCFMRSDDVLGSVTFMFFRDGTKFNWDSICRIGCVKVDRQDGQLGVFFKSGGDHFVSFRIDV